MRTVILAFACAGTMAGAARAADKPIVAPAPAWVKPATAPLDVKPDEAPLRILLSDQQVRFERGRLTVYTDGVFKIQTTQGLAAGNISLPWRPETDTLTVHALRIRRGDQVIDVLASGQNFTVVRREPNLESATLDGVLTANIQPEGLQVGDILELAVSVSSSDPVLKGHVEQFAAANWNGLPIARAHLHLEWLADVPIRLRQVGALPELKPVKTATGRTLDVSLENVQPVVPPKGAPSRYRIGWLIEATDYASWSDMAALLAPLYQTTAVIRAQGPLRVELDRIRASSTDPVVRTEAALALVQDRIRYVALAMGAGGLVPADAETTWGRRYGDCKAKTVLLLALLHALDVTAEPVAVSSVFGDGMDARLPMIGMFDHVLVRATIAGHVYWLDGTRSGDAKLDRLQVSAFGWGLPLVAGSATLVRMLPDPLTKPMRTTTLTIDARAGLTIPAPAKAEVVFSGDAAIAARLGMANLSGEARDRALSDFWRGQFDSIDVKSAGTTYDAATGEEHVTLEGVAKMDWSRGQYETDGTGLGYRADFARESGPNQDAPFAVPYPIYNRMVETILLPPGFPDTNAAPQGGVDQTVAGIHYRRSTSLKQNVFTVEKTEQSLAPEFPAKDAPDAQAALRKLAEDALYLRKPNHYRMTDAELTAAMAVTPSTSQDYVARASALKDHERVGEAMTDLDRAIALDPKNAQALAARGLLRALASPPGAADEDLEATRMDLDASAALVPRNALIFIARGLIAHKRGEFPVAETAYTSALEIDPTSVWVLTQRAFVRVSLNKLDGARKDLDAAAMLAPRDATMLATRGFLAERQGKLAEAAAAYTTSLEIAPNTPFALTRRATVYSKLGDREGALADSAAALKVTPKATELYVLRANIFLHDHNKAEGLREAAALVAASTNDTLALVSAAQIDHAFHNDDQAARLYDRALAIKPAAFIYINRMRSRSREDVAGSLSDLDAALKLEPGRPDALALKAHVQVHAKNFASAIESYNILLAKSPNDPELLTSRGIAYAGLGDAAKADADFAMASAKIKGPFQFNEACWQKATSGIALASALNDCNAALNKAPAVAAYLDSRALVLLRLGRLDEAIADYDAALSKNPKQAGSLYGRALAWSRKGDGIKAQADAAAALTQDPDIAKEFTEYGLALPAAIALQISQ